MTLTDELLTRALWDVQEQRLLELPEEKDLHHVFSNRFERKMKKMLHMEKRSPFQRKLNMYSKRAAVFILVLVLATVTTVMSASALRTQFFQMISNLYQKYSEIYFQPVQSQVSVSQPFVKYAMNYIPKGYSLVNSFSDEDLKINSLQFENSSKNRIGLNQENIATANFDVNTEGVKLEDIQINGNKAYYYENKGMHTIIWHNNEYAFLLSADVTPSLDKNEIIKIAESVVSQK